jgi:teichuronic acid biosynthesis glycosyltransferase TuaC
VVQTPNSAFVLDLSGKNYQSLGLEEAVCWHSGNGIEARGRRPSVRIERSKLTTVQPQTLLRSASSAGMASSAVIDSGAADAAIRVLAVIPGDGRGNTFIFARRQVESLVRRGIAVRVFYLPPRTSLIPLLRDYLHLRRAITAFSPSIVHAHYGAMTSFLCALTTHCPLAITFRGSDLNPEPERGFPRDEIALFLSQISTLRAAAIICASAQLRSRLWWRRARAVIAPSGVNLSLFQPRDKREARNILGWKLNERIALFNRSNCPLLKGLGLAREAVSVAEGKLGAIRFVELDDSVPPEKMPLYLNGADCLLLASEFEGSPNILKEALACNLPVASVDVGDAAERLEGVFPSRVVRRDARELGMALAEILQEQRRSNGRDHIGACSEEKVAEAVSIVYRQVLQRS